MTTQKHVLIIDDDPILAEMLKAYFYERGNKKCVVAHNGLSAIEIFDQAPEAVELITCDLNMPDCDGIEFLDMLKDRSCDVPIIIITAATKFISRSAAKLAEAHGLNFLGVINKPVRFQTLDSALAKMVFGES